MNKRRRVLVIARQFWPTISDATLRLLHWTKSLRASGIEPTILTPRWHRGWPKQIVCEEIVVERIEPVPSTGLRMGRYPRALGEWLSQHAAEFDFVYCDDCELEASTLLSYAPQLTRPPVVVRFDPLERWMAAARHHHHMLSERALHVCRRATLVVVPDIAAHQQLLSLGVLDEQIVRADSGGKRLDRSPEARAEARRMLRDVNHDLFVRSTDRVVVCPGELTRRWGVDILIRAVTPLLERHRPLRVWILGDGPERGTFYELLRHEGLHHLVAMPGIFTDPEPVLQAADLCVFPGEKCGLRWLLPTCLSSGLPSLVSDGPEARLVVGQAADSMLFRKHEATHLREKLTTWLQKPDLWDAALLQNRRRIVDSSPTLDVAGLLQKLAARASC